MAEIQFPDHNLDELSELGLLDSRSLRVLKNAGFKNIYEILNHYRIFNSFRILPGCGNYTDWQLTSLAQAYIWREETPLNPDYLHRSIKNGWYRCIPEIINWQVMPRYGKAFMAAWLNFVLFDRTNAAGRKYYEMRFGLNPDPFDFYQQTILYPLPQSTTLLYSSSRGHLDSIRTRFIMFARALQILSGPPEILKYFAGRELSMDQNHESWNLILAPAECFGFARAIYHIMASSYYNDPEQRFVDILPFRYFSLLHKSPLGLADIASQFNESKGRFYSRKKISNSHVVDSIKGIVAVLRALEFKDCYRSLPGWNDRYLTYKFVESVNTLEQVNLPISFYALLFRQLYDMRFEPTKIPKDDKKEIHYFNASGKES